MKRIVCLAFAVLMLTVLFVREVSAQPGPVTDILTFQVITGPDAKLAAMTATPPTADVWPSLSVPMDLWSSLLEEKNGGFTRTGDLAILDSIGCLITQEYGFHTGSIVYNIRADQSYRRPEVTYWPLKDVEFRHALFHSFNHLPIIESIFGYIATPVRSLVPRAQSRFYNPAIPAHPFNQGDPFTSSPGEHSSVGILKSVGYTFVDADSSGDVTDTDYWKCPDGSPLPKMEVLTPALASEPASNALVAMIIGDLAKVGLAATEANYNKGFAQVTIGFNACMAGAYNGADFDAYIVCYGVDKTPDQLYPLLHSSQDSLTYSGRKNAAGINDTAIDALCETVKFSLDWNDVEIAAKEVQYMLYRPDLPNADNFALAYMCLYSRIYFNAYDPNLACIIARSPGYGADNKWTFLSVYWAAEPRMVDTNTQVIWMLDEAPATFNSLNASTKYEWEILAQVYDGLTNVNPYTHHDIPWLASDWTITPTATGMEIDITLQDGATWQDGYPFTPEDVEFCLEFLRDYHVPRYAETWEALDDVVVTGANSVKIITTKASSDLFYDYASLAAILPPQIWDRAWPSDQAVLAYDPTSFAYGTDMAPGYSPGPTPAPTNLFGTGPWIFQFYNDVTQNGDLCANRAHFLTVQQVNSLKEDMFYEVGDYNRDGIIDVRDITFVSFAFGSMIGDPNYDPGADFNRDGIISIRDLRTVAFHLGWQRCYP
jgi:ABC-type transport system substrate-binding protein